MEKKYTSKEYKTYDEQYQAHVDFLTSKLIDVDRIMVGEDESSRNTCYLKDQPHTNENRCFYTCKLTMLKNDKWGLATWCVTPNGKWSFLSRSNAPTAAIGNTCKNVKLSLTTNVFDFYKEKADKHDLTVPDYITQLLTKNSDRK